MKVEDNDYAVMDDGHRYCFFGQIGLDPIEMQITYGHDGAFWSADSDDGEIPIAHRKEIAEFMIAKWTEYLKRIDAGGTSKEKP